jgi:small-conductance mechanosensitive channel
MKVLCQPVAFLSPFNIFSRTIWVPNIIGRFSRMKKLWILLVSTVFILGFGMNVSAATDEEITKALKLIEKTNLEIDEEIEKAVKKADKLQADYLNEIVVIEEGKEVVKLKGEKETLLTEIAMNKHDQKKIAKLMEDIAEIDSKLVKEKAKIQSKIDEIQKDINELMVSLASAEDKDTKKLQEKLKKLNKKLSEKTEKAEEKTAKYTQELEKVITNIYNLSIEMSAETIAKVAKVGIVAECSWKLVRFADQWVWIDPVRVVKFNN